MNWKNGVRILLTGVLLWNVYATDGNLWLLLTMIFIVVNIEVLACTMNRMLGTGNVPKKRSRREESQFMAMMASRHGRK